MGRAVGSSVRDVGGSGCQVAGRRKSWLVAVKTMLPRRRCCGRHRLRRLYTTSF